VDDLMPVMATVLGNDNCPWSLATMYVARAQVCVCVRARVCVFECVSSEHHVTNPLRLLRLCRFCTAARRSRSRC
jgi:hypothetical protein